MAAYATLDSTQKQCSERLIDGEELRNRLVFSVWATAW